MFLSEYKILKLAHCNNDIFHVVISMKKKELNLLNQAYGHMLGIVSESDVYCFFQLPTTIGHLIHDALQP